MTDLKQLAINPNVLRLGMAFSQYTPIQVGHRLAWWVSGAISRLRPNIYRIVLANLGQVLGPEATERELARAARHALYLSLRSSYDLFRAVGMPREKMISLVDVPETTRRVAGSLWNREGGAVLIFPHLGNFDLGGHAFVPLLPEMQLLTLPDPPLGFQLVNEMRRQGGVRVTPLSPAALREAIQLLRRGGVIATAGDRPVSELDKLVPFFGRPARVPSGHVRLALKTGAVVAVAYCVLAPDTDRYAIHLDPPLELIRTGDREEEVQVNLRRILDALQDIIRRWPEQWLMFVPVWPELMEV